MTSLLYSKTAPSICIPITGRTKEEIAEQLAIIQTEPADMIEWRADFFELLADAMQVLEVIQTIKNQTDLPLLFTIRAAHEGGEVIALSEADKVNVLERVCTDSPVDLIDYELSNSSEKRRQIQQAAQANGKEFIASYHHFTQTPSKDVLLEKGKAAERAGADVVKIAVMPEVKADVFRLLQVTAELTNRLKIPVVTMSMGEVGAISRVIGWAFGSVMTFGTAATSSAPGQPPAGKLDKAIKEMQHVAPAWQNALQDY